MSTSANEAPAHPQAYGATETTEAQAITTNYELQDQGGGDGEAFNDENVGGSEDGGGDSYDSLDDDEDRNMSMTEMLYSSSSYHAIAKPVSLTMILSALSVVFINNDATIQMGEEMMQDAYTVWRADSQSTGKNLAISLGNAFVMVSAICAMTFLIVLLYKMRCMKLLIGYMVMASATLLGVLGGTMFEVAIQIYRLPVDKLSFFWFLYNFAVVGIIAVFWTRGIPTSITQGYLIATSVILAWQLAHFDTWTTWTLLVMLALYDLCAVLTPCGPLKALVNLMQHDDAPDMPGLLYEAELPPEAQRPGVPKPTTSDLGGPPASNAARDAVALTRSMSDSKTGNESSSNGMDDPIVEIPLAIARVYNLTVVGVVDFGTKAPLLEDSMPENPTPSQLRAIVNVRLPRQGGRIEPLPGGKTYLERDRFGTPKRTIWVDRHGKVFAEATDDDSAADPKNNNSIRLGLGDFIFYSVLVGKAAQYSFATFCACMLVILAGLGGTLVLLAVYHHALPALPISIFLGVLFYILTRLLIEPWIQAMFQTPYYV